MYISTWDLDGDQITLYDQLKIPKGSHIFVYLTRESVVTQIKPDPLFFLRFKNLYIQNIMKKSSPDLLTLPYIIIQKYLALSRTAHTIHYTDHLHLPVKHTANNSTGSL